jgi:hypothetical protein
MVPGQPLEMFGWYTVHIGASDVAVMGVPPRYMTYTLLMPPETKDPVFRPKVEQRIRGMGLKYLSGPLIREVVNMALLENGLEQYRNVCTRVGTPVFDAHLIDVEFLKATLRYLSERVGAELRDNGRRARCVTLKLRYSDFMVNRRN